MQILFKDPKKMTDDEKELLVLARLEYLKAGENPSDVNRDYDLTIFSNAYHNAMLTQRTIKNMDKLKKYKYSEKLITFPDEQKYSEVIGSVGLEERQANLVRIKQFYNDRKRVLDIMIGGRNETKDKQQKESSNQKEKLTEVVGEKEKAKADKKGKKA